MRNIFVAGRVVDFEEVFTKGGINIGAHVGTCAIRDRWGLLPLPPSLPLPPGPSAFILLYCIFFCVFMFSLLSLFLCRPDITVQVDWAWNTGLLTYCSPVSLLLSLCLSLAVSSVCLSVSLSWTMSLTHFLCPWLCLSVCVCLSLLIPVTHSLALSVTLHLSVSFCLSVFLSLSPLLSEALIMILSVATRCGMVFSMLLLHNSFFVFLVLLRAVQIHSSELCVLFMMMIIRSSSSSSSSSTPPPASLLSYCWHYHHCHLPLFITTLSIMRSLCS